ncbi:TetR/AcrR family transcriptional regulator [Neorhizobium galegae]|uniref:TetR/AcrR family transcriptional regulator n=1 Tax=Neorhizobium galegae TaxID=399 RepID=UPI002104EE76|nr:TetR/AcrR family transcriptional regulator [Neorhizobium galegae]MCQ1774480.1 TetR/AcrR family transcriptional regulator [Neorhizobium galegae]MCQ1799792.1 TetR/AcrR family transcriptional regulator [Neorhizobium galegae]
MSRTIREGAHIDVARSAARLFLEKGVASTSGDEIAEAAGISKRTLWRYFRTKESCIEPLFALTSQRFAAKLQNWPLDISVERFLEINYDFSKMEEQEIEDGRLVVHLIARLEEEPALLEPFFMSTRMTETLLADVIASRLDLAPSDFEVRLCAATVAAGMRVIDETISRAAVKYGQVPTLAETNDRLAQAIRRASTLPFCDPIKPRHG